MISARHFSFIAAVVIGMTAMLASPAAAGQAVSSIAAPGHDAASPELVALARHLNVAPSELSAIADQGVLPGGWAQTLQDAYATGLDVGTSAGLDAAHASFVAGQFVACLTRIEREARSRGSATFSDLVGTVRRDVRETLRLNVGDDVAAAAELRLSGLAPLQTH